MDVGLSAPPPGVLLELTQFEHELRHRVTDDGRYLVSAHGEPDHQEPVEVGWGIEREALAPESLDRLRDALRACDFFNLPATLPPSIAARVAPLSGGPLRREPLAVGARLDQQAHVVRVDADPRVAPSAGPLEPVLDALWAELLAPPGIG